MQTIRIDKKDDIEIVSLAMPATLNAMTPEMAEELGEYFASLAERPFVRVVLLRAEGRVFCAGAALGSSAFSAHGAGRAHKQLAMQRLYSRIPRLMRACPQPIIALIQGAACGAGFSLILAADIRIASPEAKMNAAYLRVGVGGCDMGSGYFLPRLVGVAAASEILLTGKFILAERARQMNLVSDIVPAQDLLAAGLALADEMCLASPLGLRLTKETLNFAMDAPSLDAVLSAEDRQQVILLETADHQEAVLAFKEKRRPRYEDK